MSSNEIVSVSVALEPRDSRCRYWAKYLPAGTPLPMPSAVNGANDLPGGYLRKGDEIELFPGDFLLEGEANHHVKQRGWTYDLASVTLAGRKWTVSTDVKAFIKAAVAAGHMDASFAKDLLRGAGQVAALCRAVHYYRARAEAGNGAGTAITLGLRALCGNE